MTVRHETGSTLLVAMLVLTLESGGQAVLAHGDDEHGAVPPDGHGLHGSPAPSSSAPTGSPSPVGSPLPAASSSRLGSLAPDHLEASGIVLSVDSPALGRVDAFVLLTDEGERLDFDTSGLAFDPAFPVSHIAEHQMTSDPVKVTYMTDGDRLVVIALADAE